MRKSIIATLVLSLSVAAIPAHAKGGYIGGQRAAAIAKAKVGGGKIDDVDLEHSRRYRTGNSDDCHRPSRRGHRSGHYHDYDDDHDDD